MFLKDIFPLIPSDITTKNSYIIKDKRHNNVYYLVIGGFKRVTKFLEWLYGNSKLSLKRKRAKYKEIVSFSKHIRNKK